jgi:surface carbohydrate biosynthesis protein
MYINKFFFKIPDHNSHLIYKEFFQDFKKIQKELSIDNSVDIVSNEYINLYILFRNLISIPSYPIMIRYGLKISYFYTYINIVKPKFFITSIDNDKNFYILKKFFKNIKFLSFQNGFRRKQNDFFGDKELNADKSLNCDFFFVWGSFFKKNYQKFIKSKYIISGSIKSTFAKNVNLVIAEKKIIYISSAKENYNSILKNNNKSNQLLSYINYEKKLLNKIFLYCKKRGYKLNILSRSNSVEEKKYFKRILLSNNFNFITADKIEKYKILGNYQISLAIMSSLGIENLSMGRKTVFFPPRNNIKTNIFNDLDFAWPNKTKNNYTFFYRDPDIETVTKIIDKTLNLNLDDWKIRTRYLKSFIKFLKYGNFKSILKELKIN